MLMPITMQFTLLQSTHHHIIPSPLCHSAEGLPPAGLWTSKHLGMCDSSILTTCPSHLGLLFITIISTIFKTATCTPLNSVFLFLIYLVTPKITRTQPTTIKQGRKNNTFEKPHLCASLHSFLIPQHPVETSENLRSLTYPHTNLPIMSVTQRNCTSKNHNSSTTKTGVSPDLRQIFLD